MDVLFHIEMNDCCVLGIKADLFNPPDRHACNEDLASGLEATNVGEPCVHPVGGSTKSYTGPSLLCKPDDGGDSQQNKCADR